jgi:ABC-2 type transport system ATP-binding protein
VLAGLSLAVMPGEAYALVGPNGAGKSTAARVACGLMAPTSGAVDRVGDRIGLAPQETALFTALTIRENLLTMARLGGVPRAERAAAVNRALALANCVDRADDRVDALSGGWKRRANLAAALVCAPALLVLDEPTEGVDATTRSALASGVRAALQEDAGCLLISHDAAFVAAAADRIGVLDRGRLVAEGPLGDLLDRSFGSARRLTARFPITASAAVQRALADAGLSASKDRATWTRIGADVDLIASALSGSVQDNGGEISVRRPDLDDLLADLTGQAP